MSNTLKEAKVTLARASVELGSRGLQDWDNFIQAVRAYDREAQKLLVQSPVELLQVIQGRAQGIAQLLETFEQCKQIAETANQIEKANKNERRS